MIKNEKKLVKKMMKCVFTETNWKLEKTIKMAKNPEKNIKN